MSEFLEQLTRQPFLQRALLAGLLAAIACGIVGTYVVIRRITYVAGGIAHCVLGGIGAAVYLREVHHWDALEPLHGAVVAALLAALGVGVMTLRGAHREDTIIGAMWAVGMATGILFLSATPGYAADPMTFLFGDILAVSIKDLGLIATLDAVLVVVVLLFHHHLLAVCFDEEFARVRGLAADWYYLLLLGLTALTVVVLVKVVGIILLIALLALPAATAGIFCRTATGIMLLATMLVATSCFAGMALSFEPNLPPGAVIVLLVAAVYLVCSLGAWVVRRLRGLSAAGAPAKVAPR